MSAVTAFVGLPRIRKYDVHSTASQSTAILLCFSDNDAPLTLHGDADAFRALAKAAEQAADSIDAAARQVTKDRLASLERLTTNLTLAPFSSSRSDAEPLTAAVRPVMERRGGCLACDGSDCHCGGAA